MSTWLIRNPMQDSDIPYTIDCPIYVVGIASPLQALQTP